MKLLVSVLLFYFLSIIFPTFVSAADYYVAPTLNPNGTTNTLGNDANPGTISQPWKTFTKAWSVMRPGDTLFLMDGEFHQVLAPTISGTSNPAINLNDYQTYPLDHPDRIKNFIKVKAQNDGKAVINGRYTDYVVSIGWEGTGNWDKGDYFLVEGLIGKNSKGSVFYAANVQNIIFRRNSGYNANKYDNYSVFSVWAGGTPTNPANILLEDNVAAGSGRKMFIAYVSYINVVFRRNFAAFQYWEGGGTYCGSPWPQTDGIEIYPERGGNQPDHPNNSIMENNINFGLTMNSGISFSPNTGIRYGNHILGNMALGTGLRWNNSTRQFETKRFDGGPLIDISGSPTDRNSGHFCVINGLEMPDNCRITQNSTCQLRDNLSRVGMPVGVFERPQLHNTIVKDNFLAHNGQMGLVPGPWDSSSTNNTLSSNTIINNGIGDPPALVGAWNAAGFDAAMSHLSIADPTNSFPHLNWFSTLSNLKIGKVWDIDNFGQVAPNPAPGNGATLQNRYQYGQLTTVPLWPWPMEDRIKREFADPSLFQADGIQGRVWTNFSVTNSVCQNFMLPQGAVTSCPTTNSPSPTITPNPYDFDNDGNIDFNDLKLFLTRPFTIFDFNHLVQLF